MKKTIKVAIVGATGLVGQSFLKVLEEFNLPIDEYKLFASKKNAGKVMRFMGKDHTVNELLTTSFDEGFDFALFSAGTAVSKIFAPIAAETGCIVIDNSSYWRMNQNVPLIVPQVNIKDVYAHNNIIANPNCSTIQAVVALYPIHKKYKIKRIIFSTYQAVSGAGKAGYDDLKNGIFSYINNSKYQLEKFLYPIFNNCIPQIDVFLENGYTKEEEKMIEETRKILNEPNLPITATTVRVPVFNSHSEAINIELSTNFEIEDVKSILRDSDGIVVEDDINNNSYPMPINCTDKNEVFIGRIRRDFSVTNGLNLWVVADNIRKGAATNAIEILSYLLTNETHSKKTLFF